MSIELWCQAQGQRLMPLKGHPYQETGPCRVPDECPAEVEQLLSRCLMADPAVRPNCREIVEVLTQLEDTSAPPPRSPSPGIGQQRADL